MPESPLAAGGLYGIEGNTTRFDVPANRPDLGGAPALRIGRPLRMMPGHDDASSGATLEQRADLPPRVRVLLGALANATRTHFRTAIPRALDEFENALFKLAERASSNAQQQERFENLREIKRRRGDVTPRFLADAESALAQIRTPAPETRAAPPVAVDARAALELVDASVLEEELALQEIASKSEIRNSQALYAFAHRLGVIAGTSAWPSETLPLGPARLAAAFRHALSNIKLGVETRVLAYRQFDRVAMLPLATFYQTLNDYLAGQRVLPNLQWQPNRQRGDSVREALVQHATREALAQEPATASTPISADAGDAELFRTLRQLLGERRNEDGGDAAADAAIPHAKPDDVQQLLGMLQRDPQLRDNAAASRYDSEQFKQSLLADLRRGRANAKSLKLADEDADTVDLVGLLFDHITENLRDGSGANSLLNRLHVPVLRVALGDKTFFTRRSHPARELLNTIVQTGASWLDESDADPDLARKMQLVVDRVSHEYDGDLGVFENLLTDLGRHMQTLARRAEVVERRHIDAAKGRDKLDIARDVARSAIARVIQGGEPSAAVRVLLERAWTDALALTALRQGSGSAEFKRRLGVAIKLARRGAATSPEVAGDETLQQELDAGLLQVGLHVEDIAGIRSDIFTAPSPPASATPPATHGGAAPTAAPTPAPEVRIDRLLREKTRLGGEPAPGAGAQATRNVPLTATESAMVDRLRSIPFGTLFDFVQNQQGATIRRKLAWFSTVTGRCLFVNQRGARSEGRTLEQLARDIVLGQARIVADEDGTLIDRAWKAILQKLRLRSADSGAQGAPA